MNNCRKLCPANLQTNPEALKPTIVMVAKDPHQKIINLMTYFNISIQQKCKDFFKVMKFILIS